MGLFGNKETCSLCGGKVSMLGKLQVTDGVVCGACRAKCSPLATSLPLMTVKQISDHIQERDRNAVAYKSFSPTDRVGNYLMIDRRAQTWCSPCLDKKNPDLFPFSDILDFELVEDGVSITKGGLGSAIVGSGIGKKQKDMVNRMAVVINMRNPLVSKVEIPLITAETKRGGLTHKSSKQLGEQIVALLSVIVDSQRHTSAQHGAGSSADELLKFKQLLDAGAITQDEYDAKKKEILGL